MILRFVVRFETASRKEKAAIPGLSINVTYKKRNRPLDNIHRPRDSENSQKNIDDRRINRKPNGHAGVKS
jgi:hypothetical protein